MSTFRQGKNFSQTLFGTICNTSIKDKKETIDQLSEHFILLWTLTYQMLVYILLHYSCSKLTCRVSLGLTLTVLSFNNFLYSEDILADSII